MTDEAAMTMRDFLIGKLESCANWRARKAEEYPDDPRNACAAAALEAAAREVRAMLSEDLRLARLEWLAGTEDADADAYWLEEAYRIISRHGFDRVEATTNELTR